MEARTNPLGWPTWAWRGALALAVLMMAWNVVGGLSGLARSTGMLHDSGQLGAGFIPPAGGAIGWVEAVAVTPGGAAEAAGIRAGDLVRFEGALGFTRRDMRADQPKAVTVQRDGRQFRARIVPRPLAYEGRMAGVAMLVAFGGLLTTGFALLVLVRGRHSRAAPALAMILLAIAFGGQPWAPSDGIAGLWWFVTVVKSVFFALFWPLFALEVSGGASSRGQARLVAMVAAAASILGVLGDIAAAIPVRFPVSPSWFYGGFYAALQLFGYALIANNYHRNDAPARNRIKIVLGAFVVLLASILLRNQIITSLALGSGLEQQFWLIVGANLLAYASLGLLVYAVLKQRLFDLKFALNRTLVYGGLSFILLAGFGLAEWAIKHLLPEEWQKGSDFYSAGIALLLFLSIHRVRDWVEKHVERLLFRAWHENEAALRRFVAAAGHFDRTPALCRAFVQEVTRFAGGAGAALYLSTAGGCYRLCSGKLGSARKSYSGDDRALALMRAEREPVRLAQAHSALPGELALPMLDQARLAGFVLLGNKRDGSDYRPDEVEALGWAAHQIGLDLQAMHARELSAEVASLNAKVSSLSEERDRLSGLLAKTHRRGRAGNGVKRALPA